MSDRLDLVVVGGGISGLSVAWRVLQARPDAKIAVLEAGDRPGGTATTDKVGEFIIDRGPNGVLTSMPDTLELAADVGVQAVPAAEEAKKRYFWVGGKLRALPDRLADFSMLGPGGMFRMFMEPFVSSFRPPDDESVGDFAARRFGARTRLLVGPMVSGVSAGDADQTSMRALFPKFDQLEAEHGSVIKGLFRSRGKKELPRGTSRSGLHTFVGGMGVLPDTLAQKLGDRLRLSTSVLSVAHSDGGWSISTNKGTLQARRLVLATPSHVSAALMAPLLNDFAAPAAAIPYTDIRVVTLAFARDKVQNPLQGFGFLVPRSEGLNILGSVWTSTIFPDRAPADTHLFRVMIGGVHLPEAADWEDAYAESVVLADLQKVIGVQGAPLMAHHTRWKQAIPQYTLGHLDRVAAAQEALSALPGVYLCGNAWEGLSMNDCVNLSNRVAEAVVGSAGF